MSADVWLVIDTGGPEPATVTDTVNVTYNLTRGVHADGRGRRGAPARQLGRLAVTPPPATPCVGSCNRHYRAALAAGIDDATHVAGLPVWCGDCGNAIAAALDELPDLLTALDAEVDQQRAAGGDAPITGSRGRPSPSPIVDDIDEITRLLEYWEDAHREYAGHPARPPRGSGRRPGAAARWLATHLVVVLAAPFAEELGRDVTRLHRLARRRTATDQAKARKPVPCPGCDLLALVHAAGDKYIGCDSCGRLLSFDEYDAWTRLAAAGQDTRRTA